LNFDHRSQLLLRKTEFQSFRPKLVPEITSFGTDLARTVKLETPLEVSPPTNGRMIDRCLSKMPEKRLQLLKKRASNRSPLASHLPRDELDLKIQLGSRKLKSGQPIAFESSNTHSSRQSEKYAAQLKVSNG
jgi:hypothetical protein